MTLIETVRNYIASCPLLENNAILGIDKLDSEGIAYTIDAIPSDPVVKRYTDGGQMRQFQFVFASRQYYGMNVIENLENSGFYENFVDWIERNNEMGLSNFINLGMDRKALEIAINSAPYVYDAEENTARYQVQLSLKYYQSWRYYHG